jgi:ribosome modulation factor
VATLDDYAYLQGYRDGLNGKAAMNANGTSAWHFGWRDGNHDRQEVFDRFQLENRILTIDREMERLQD